MKRYFSLLMLILLFYTGNAYAFEFVECELRDRRFIDKFTYAIDIYASSTQDPFELGDTTLNIDFNDTALSLSSTPLLNQNPVFNGGNYNPMSIQPHPTISGRLQFIISVTPAATSGDIIPTLPAPPTLLATVQFDIDNTVYSTEFADVSAFPANSTMLIFGSIGPGALLSWTGSDTLDLICTPQINGAPGNSAEVGVLYDFQPMVNDVCSSGPFTFYITNPPAWATTFDSNTGQVTGTPTSGDVGTDVGIVITVEDIYGDTSDLTAFDIQVTSSTSAGTSSAATGGGGGGGGCFISSMFFF